MDEGLGSIRIIMWFELWIGVPVFQFFSLLERLFGWFFPGLGTCSYCSAALWDLKSSP